MKKYFISNKTKKDGPFSVDEIKGLNLTDEYSVWCEGMDNWVKISEVDELNACFAKSPPPTQVELNKNHLITCIKNTTKATLLVHLLIGTLIFIIAGGYLSGNDLVSIYSQPKLANLEAIYFADGWDAKRFYLLFSYLYTLPISILIGYFIYKKTQSDTDYTKKAIKIIIMTIAILIPITFMSSYTYHKTVYPELFEAAPATEPPPTEEAAPAPEETATSIEDSSSVYKDSVAVNDRAINASSVSLCGIKLGSISNIQENENMKILASETIEGKNHKKYQLSDGNIASTTTDIQTNKIIYIEYDWSYSLKANTAANGYIFGFTSLDDIRNNNHSNGFAWTSNVIQKSEKGALLFNAYPVTQNTNSVVVFVTEIDNPFEQSGSAKLVGIILAKESYLNEIWGNEKAYDSNVYPIAWQ